MTQKEKREVAWLMADQLVFAMDKYSGCEEQFEIAVSNLQVLTDRFQHPDDIMLEYDKSTGKSFSLLVAAYTYQKLEQAFESSKQVAASVREAILPLLEKEVEDFFSGRTSLPEAPLS